MTEPVTSELRRAFSIACRVDINVHATTPRLWSLLTNAQGFPRWNSTVTRIDGDIREGGKLRVHVPGTARVFSPTVSDVVPNSHMSWTGGLSPIFKGVRTFELRPNGDGTTHFTMAERFSGLMVAVLKRSLPVFGRSSRGTRAISRTRPSGNARRARLSVDRACQPYPRAPGVRLRARRFGATAFAWPAEPKLTRIDAGVSG